DHCLILLHPIMPFLTEALWDDLAARERLLICAPWPEIGVDAADRAADAEIGWVIRLIEGIRSIRAELNVPPKARIAMVLTGYSAEAEARLSRNLPLIERLGGLSEAIAADEAPAGSVTLALEDSTANLQLADVINIEAERARLSKSLARIRKESSGLAQKLANEKFLAKAPEQVIEEQRERLAISESEAAKIEAAIKRLAELA
ncbi:MAG TPA: class I tRNA ligase family protein, partial [Paracoccaceae bacterium]|nr:class I tRNA ligase family protein [Paracoccaceae bacterium]